MPKNYINYWNYLLEVFTIQVLMQLNITIFQKKLKYSTLLQILHLYPSVCFSKYDKISVLLTVPNKFRWAALFLFWNCISSSSDWSDTRLKFDIITSLFSLATFMSSFNIIFETSLELPCSRAPNEFAWWALNFGEWIPGTPPEIVRWIFVWWDDRELNRGVFDDRRTLHRGLSWNDVMIEEILVEFEVVLIYQTRFQCYENYSHCYSKPFSN